MTWRLLSDACLIPCGLSGSLLYEPCRVAFPPVESNFSKEALVFSCATFSSGRFVLESCVALAGVTVFRAIKVVLGGVSVGHACYDRDCFYLHLHLHFVW